MRKIKKPPDKNNIKKYENYLTSYKCVKTSLKSIVRNKKTLNVINNTICKVNVIIIHTYHFLKLFCLNYYNKKGSLPTIDKDLITLIIKTIAVSDNRGRLFSNSKKDLMNELKDFFNNVYEPTMLETHKLSYTNMGNIIEYQATSIITCLSNHIQEHFSEMVNRYVNVMFNKKKLLEDEKCDNKKYKLRTMLKTIKNDIIYNENKSDIKHKVFIENYRKNILKNVKIDKSLAYMAKSKKSLDLLIIAIRMSIEAEKKSLKSQKSEEKGQLVKVINCFPLRKTIRPKYIDIDTSIIILNLIAKNKGKYNKNKLKLFKKIWKRFFKMDKKVFKKNGYKFNRRITTDGVGCSILFVRNDLYDPLKKTSVRTIKKPKGYREDIYINDINDEDRKYCLDKQLIGIDPGKNELIYCTNGDVKEIHKENGKTFRKTTHYSYSQKLRKETIKSEIYMNKLDKDKKDTKINFKRINKRRVCKKTVKEIECLLSGLNSSSCIWSKAIKYIKLKNETNHSLLSYYEKEIHRELNWYSFINKQKSDADMINRFKNKFGDGNKNVILIGDYEQIKQMKYKEPSKGKSIRKLFRDNDYKVYLVDEFSQQSLIANLATLSLRTSCRLYEDGKELVNVRDCHALLGDNILKEKLRASNKADEFTKELIESGYKPTIINRDLNGSLNIRLKGMSILNGWRVPNYMNRKIVMQKKADALKNK